MSPITFNCPSCNAPIDYTGKTDLMIRCSHCNNVVFVPEAVRQAARTASSATPTASPPPSAPPGVPVYYAASTYPARSAVRAGAAITIGSMVFSIMLTIGICVIIAAAGAGFFLLFRNHAVYTQAVELAKNDPAVIEMFGSPVNDGFFVTGETSEGTSSGSASFSTSISGPKASGQMTIVGSKEGGQWRVVFITIYVNGERVLFYDSNHSEEGFQRVP